MIPDYPNNSKVLIICSLRTAYTGIELNHSPAVIAGSWKRTCSVDPDHTLRPPVFLRAQWWSFGLNLDAPQREEESNCF